MARQLEDDAMCMDRKVGQERAWDSAFFQKVEIIVHSVHTIENASDVLGRQQRTTTCGLLYASPLIRWF